MRDACESARIRCVTYRATSRRYEAELTYLVCSYRRERRDGGFSRDA